MLISDFAKVIFCVLVFVGCGKKCEDCPLQCERCQQPPAGSNGIPYRYCQTGAPCTQTALDNSGIDPDHYLKPNLNVCEGNWCRAYYQDGGVCAPEDTVKCGRAGAPGAVGTSTCTNGNWGPCNP